ncbi:DegT/DnrJ/EryC1/StrS family aminotransferase, partial [candidate division WOR-3 bacterium]|nr:DegT/DnrJ/EryC1/StrS family aminotransferase [candidate division WOR-3 bacterium]
NRVLESGKWGSINGNFVREFEKKYCDFSNIDHGVAVVNGSIALYLALKSCGIGPGDEVIVPAYTFIASASSVLDALAKPVFADIDPTTLNIDPSSVEDKISPDTRAIMPVHFAGRQADMVRIHKIAEKHNLRVIEDACQAWGSSYSGHTTGSLSDAACFSFQSSKNISSGEGGMIITKSQEIFSTARSLGNCGRSETGLWYAHYNYGGNYRMTEFQAAILSAQLSRYPELHAKRQANAFELQKRIKDIEGYKTLSPLEKDSVSSWHIFPFSIDIKAWHGLTKGEIVDAVRAEGIPLSAGYSLPVYRQPVFLDKNFGPGGGPTSFYKTPFPDFELYSLPNTERACFEETLWITQNALLSEKKMIDRIVEALVKVFEFKDEMRS